MSPQNGHIRCEAKSPAWRSILRSFRSDAANKASRLRRPARNGCGAKDMVETPPYEELCKLKHVTSHPVDSVQDCSLQTKSTDSSPGSIRGHSKPASEQYRPAILVSCA